MLTYVSCVEIVEIPTLRAVQPISKQYEGWTLSTIQGPLESREYYGMNVSIPLFNLYLYILNRGILGKELVRCPKSFPISSQQSPPITTH